jgi:rSAM/selenodomain-associated transferase 2
MLSIIIPTLNEAQQLPRLLRQLQMQREVQLDLIVCDGGSSDDTPMLAQQLGARVVTSARGRGHQMNAGAAQARGEFLLFLHADSQLQSPTLLSQALATLALEPADEIVAGHFPLRFTDTPPQAAGFYRYAEGKTALNRRYTINGDQGLLIRALHFRELGGYDERLPFLEDQRFAERVWARGRWIVLPGQLLTSARRFEAEGRRERSTLMVLIMAMHVGGVDEFFARAPAVYAAQSDTGRLDLAPQLRLIRRILWERRWRGTLATLYRIGSFVRENTWQLFYWRDQHHGAGDLPRLAYYDRWLDRLLRNPLGNSAAAVLACLWFFVWLPLCPPRSR